MADWEKQVQGREIVRQIVNEDNTKTSKYHKKASRAKFSCCLQSLTPQKPINTSPGLGLLLGQIFEPLIN